MYLTFAIQSGSLGQFLDHWSAKYRDANFRDRDLYEPYVGKPMTEGSRRSLFEWKNGSSLSKRKSISIEKHYPLFAEINELKEKYLDPAGDGGAIWNIFYMHCADPQHWQIFRPTHLPGDEFHENRKTERDPLQKVRYLYCLSNGIHSIREASECTSKES